MLHGIWSSTLLSQKIKCFLTDTILINQFDKLMLERIFNFIDNGKWNEAKSIWILEVLKLSSNENNEFNTYSDCFWLHVLLVV